MVRVDWQFFSEFLSENKFLKKGQNLDFFFQKVEKNSKLKKYNQIFEIFVPKEHYLS